MGRLPPEVPPEHLGGAGPGAAGRKAGQDQPARRPAQNRLHLAVPVGAWIVPGDIDFACRMLPREGFEQFGDLTPAFSAAEQNHRLAGMPAAFRRIRTVS